MKDSNLGKLADLLNTAIDIRLRNQSPAFEIELPHYASLYFDIFFDELKLNGEPVHCDRFSVDLGSRLKQDLNSDEAKEVMEYFINYWSAWTELYRELNRRGMIKRDD